VGQSAKRLEDKLNTERRQLENLNRQVERTGDSDGFAHEIERVEVDIGNPKKHIDNTKTKQANFERAISSLIRQMASVGCRNVA
jgi:hypothetical protein